MDVTVCSCSRCAFSTLRYDKLKEHLHKQHNVGSAPERRVRITDLVNHDIGNSLDGAVCQQPEPNAAESSEDQSADGPSTSIVMRQTVNCVVDLNVTEAGSCSESQHSVVDGSSVVIVEPADFLLGSIQTIKLNIPATSLVLDADSVKQN